MQRALIVGHTGQDGRILWDQLSSAGFSLVGVASSAVSTHDFSWTDRVSVVDVASVERLLIQLRPDQIYYLAAHHHSSQDNIADSDLWQRSLAVHVTGWFNVLDAAQRMLPSARLFYASSSRIFGSAAQNPQNERTPYRPACIYGATKASGMMLAQYFRHGHGLFVSCGILYNHESPRRAQQFVSQRIADGLAAIHLGRQDKLEIGDLETHVDWGYAPDYTQAMQLILAAPTPDDFVVASGELHSIREMIEIAADHLGLRWQQHIVQRPGLLKRSSQQLCGDASHLRGTTGWKPSRTFREVVIELVQAAVTRQQTVSA
jgi:GDPmannose 4,6-dehydratase